MTNLPCGIDPTAEGLRKLADAIDEGACYVLGTGFRKINEGRIEITIFVEELVRAVKAEE